MGFKVKAKRWISKPPVKSGGQEQHWLRLEIKRRRAEKIDKDKQEKGKP
jgi:hypothetical protein